MKNPCNECIIRPMCNPMCNPMCEEYVDWYLQNHLPIKKNEDGIIPCYDCLETNRILKKPLPDDNVCNVCHLAFPNNFS